MYYWRFWQWKNGKRNENGEYANNIEYSDYVVAPIFIEDKLDETLDSGEIILKSMPIETKTAFPPKTKFRLERYTVDPWETANAKPEKTWDFIVEHDDVEEYEGCPEICTHRIHLIEASAVAQGMHVDNIALTYELQDVTLDYKTIAGTSDTIDDMGYIQIKSNGYNKTPIHSNPRIRIPDMGQTQIYYFENSYFYQWNGGDDLRALKFEQDGREAHTIKFVIPTLMRKGAMCLVLGVTSLKCKQKRQ